MTELNTTTHAAGRSAGRSLIETLRVDGTTITYELDPTLRELEAQGDLWVRYPDGVDVGTVPEEIKLLPVSYFFAPLVWAFDATYSVPHLDERALESFRAIRDYYRRVYPGLQWAGELRAEQSSRVEPSARTGGAAALFTGGVDSTYLALAADERLLLVTVWEARTARNSPNRSYLSWLAQVRDAAGQLGHELALIATNGWQVLNRTRVRDRLSERQKFHNWWADVHFGMVLTSLTAPLLYLKGIERLRIAGGSMGERIALEGLSIGGPPPDDGTAATPYVDEAISLGPARVEHDLRGTRQEKIDRIVTHPAFATGSGWPLRVCLVAPYDSAENCTNCEKCLRTVASVIVAGGDPRRYGFPHYTDQVLRSIQKRFDGQRMPFSRTRALNWQGTQRAAADRLGDQRPGAQQEFVRWLASFDFDSYLHVAPHRKPVGLLRRLRRLPWLPSLYLRARMKIEHWSARAGR